MKDEIYREPLEKSEKFEFSEKVAGVFHDMISRSVPDYEANQIMTAEMTAFFYKENTQIYDLGCSIGTTAHNIRRVFQNRPFLYTGIDNSMPMVEKARAAAVELSTGFSKEQSIEFIKGDIESFNYKETSAVISNYTFQFIAPESRLNLLKKIYSALCTEGVFLLSEKVVEADPVFTQLFSNLHHKMKRAHGYSDLEIIQKRDALENVLIPNDTNKNIELLKEAGFKSVSIYHKWYNFASYIALKK